jgi:hypothetical protein
MVIEASGSLANLGTIFSFIGLGSYLLVLGILVSIIGGSVGNR